MTLSRLVPRARSAWDFAVAAAYPFRGAWFVLGNPLFLKLVVGLVAQEVVLATVLYVLMAVASSAVWGTITVVNLANGLAAVVFTLIHATMFGLAALLAASIVRAANTQAIAAMVDGVYTVQGHHQMVLRARLRRRYARLKSLPYQSRRRVVASLRTYVLLMWIPKTLLQLAMLHLVPFLGPLVSAFCHLGAVGLSYNQRWFENHGMNPNQKTALYARFKPMYYGYGLAASICTLVPVVGPLAYYVLVVGAALMSCNHFV